MDRRSFLKATAYAASLASLPGIAFSARAADSKILRMGYGSDVLTLDPIKTVYGSDIIIQGMMFARLLQANADRSEVGPGLAEKWDISEDGRPTPSICATRNSRTARRSPPRTSPSAIPACASRRIRPMPRPSSR
jgi:ABC-type transport system substrate-binding protein